MEVVNKEKAQEEVNKWLTNKKVGPLKRESQANQIDVLVEAVCEGYLVLNSDFSFEHTLKFPTTEGKPITKLTYKPRITLGNVNPYLQNVKAADVDGRILAYVAALTGEAKEILRRLDSEDSSISQAIALFFL